MRGSSSLGRMRIAAALAVVGTAVAAAILVNLALLGYAQPRNDPVGNLSPRNVIRPAAPAAPQPPPAPAAGEETGPDD